MQSIGSLLAATPAMSGPLAAARKKAIREPRKYRVSLCVMSFAEIEVETTRPFAEQEALANATKAKRKFKTAPAAYKVEQLVLSDPRNPESPLVWKEAPAAYE